MFNDVKLWYLL